MSLELRPQNDEIEITLIGTGGGYGESVVIHVGNQEWIVVDSCVNPKTNRSLPLEYLMSLGVDCEKEVKLIICTHWHDDHVKGIAELFSECKSAGFSIAQTIDNKKFLSFLSLDYNKVEGRISNSSTIEFNKCLELIELRSVPVKMASSDRLLYSLRNKDTYVEVFSLSPSDYSISVFTKEISELITEYGPKNKKIITESPNERSIALYLKFGSHRAILGADLEVGDNSISGWHNVVNHVHCIDKDLKSSFFKIPHHGSENGYNADIWNSLVAKNPVSTLTPWNRNAGLPSNKMIDTYCSLSNNVYITSKPKTDTPKKRGHKIEKTIKELGLDIREVAFKYGRIRSRINILDENPEWEVVTFGAAYKL